MEREERSEVITMRVTARDKRAFEKGAEAEGMTLSEYVRACALLYMAMTLNPHGLRMLARGILGTVEDGLRKLGRKRSGVKTGKGM